VRPAGAGMGGGWDGVEVRAAGDPRTGGLVVPRDIDVRADDGGWGYGGGCVDLTDAGVAWARVDRMGMRGGRDGGGEGMGVRQMGLRRERWPCRRYHVHRSAEAHNRISLSGGRQ